MKKESSLFYILIILLFTVPLLPSFYLGYSHYNTTNSQIEFLQKELIGVNHLQLLFESAKRLDTIPTKQADIELSNRSTDIIRSDIFEKKVYGIEDLNTLRLTDLKHFDFSKPTEEYFPLLLNAIEVILDRSNLILDGNLDSYYLMSALHIKYPRLLLFNEKLTHNRAFNIFESDRFLYEEFARTVTEVIRMVNKAIEYNKDQFLTEVQKENLRLVMRGLGSDWKTHEELINSFEKYELDLSKSISNSLRGLFQGRINDKKNHSFRSSP